LSLNITQGSAEWLALRRQKITSTDSGVLLGLNPFKTKFQLWSEKMELIEPQKSNFRMEYGTLNEPMARTELNKVSKINFEPGVFIHPKLDWMMASCDGVSKCGRYACEIKCSEKTYKQAQLGVIEPYYIAQMQHTMAVLCISSMTYMAWYDGQYETIEVSRNQDMINDIIKIGGDFYFDNIVSMTPPELTDKDYVNNESADLAYALIQYEKTVEQFVLLEQEKEMWRDRVVTLCDGKSSKGSGYKITRTIRKGNVDYKSIEILKDYDLEKHRKPASEMWTIRKSSD